MGLVGAWALTIAVASVPLTRLTARVPRRRLFTLILLLLALATTGTALAPSYGWALTSRITAAAAHGLFWSLLVPTVATLVQPARTGRAVSVVLAGPAMASIVGIPLGATVGVSLGWRVSFGALAALLTLAALGIRSLPLSDAPQPAVRQEGRDPALWTVLGVALAGGLVITGHFLLYTYIAPLLKQFGGYDNATSGILLFVFGAAGVVGTIGAGSLSDRFPRQALSWVSAAFMRQRRLTAPAQSPSLRCSRGDRRLGRTHRVAATGLPDAPATDRLPRSGGRLRGDRHHRAQPRYRHRGDARRGSTRQLAGRSPTRRRRRGHRRSHLRTGGQRTPRQGPPPVRIPELSPPTLSEKVTTSEAQVHRIAPPQKKWGRRL